MRVAAILQRYNDFDQPAEWLSGLGQAYQQVEQVDSGPYSGAHLACSGEVVSFFAEHATRRLAKRGVGPSGVISAVVLLDSSGRVLLNGAPFTFDDLLLVGPGGAYEAVADAGVQPAVFSVSLDLAAAVPLRRLSYPQEGRIRRVTNPELTRQFRDAAARVLRSWDEASQTVSLPQPALLGLMLCLLTAPSAANGSSHVSIQIYRAARDVMLGSLREPLTVPEIASRVGTSRSTLELAFDRCVSVSPARFYKLLRLNNARRLLESGKYSVTEAADSSGLSHLGRFSGDYRDLFGELPSETALQARVLIAEPD